MTIGVVLLCSLSVALLAMLSFLPKLDLPWFLGGKRAGPHDPNLLYFGDISKQLTLTVLETDLHARYFPKSKLPRDEYIHDLVVQIGVNSQITMRKMRFFRCAMGLILVGGLVLLIPIIGLIFQTAKSLW